jgi:hypothetical protein
MFTIKTLYNLIKHLYSLYNVKQYKNYIKNREKIKNRRKFVNLVYLVFNTPDIFPSLDRSRCHINLAIVSI